MVEYQRNDIVRLKETKFKELREQLWFKDNAFAVSEVSEAGMVSLTEIDKPVAVSDLKQMPISKKYAGNIYYDPIIAASFIDPNDEIPIHSTDYTYFMDAFKNVTEEDGTTLCDQVEKEGFKYVHEVQHWLRERYGSDDLRIRHKFITLAENQKRRLWNLRDSMLEAGVSTYQFLYEIANMLYLRWMAFYDEKALERWKELERTNGDELLDKYQQAIQRIKQKTRIYSSSALGQAINEVSKCAKKENIAEVFDLILEENSRMKGGGATQNVTPRVLAELLVELMRPQLFERWHDPAAGFSGFLVEIDKYLRRENNNYQSLPKDEKAFQLTEALSGMEIQKEIAWIGLCNTRFHGLWCDVKDGDSLETVVFQQYDGIICEPPMPVYTLTEKSKSNNGKRNRLTAFVELILNSLSMQEYSRAAILLPEGFFWNSSSDYRYTRKRLYNQFCVDAILRLPKGIYLGSSVSMCALFFKRHGYNDNRVLLYDMRAEKTESGQRQDLAMFDGFIKAFRGGEHDSRCKSIRLDEIRDDDYKITFENDSYKEELQIETPANYLTEANKIVREIRSLLVKIEKEIDG